MNKKSHTTQSCKQIYTISYALFLSRWFVFDGFCLRFLYVSNFLQKQKKIIIMKISSSCVLWQCAHRFIPFSVVCRCFIRSSACQMLKQKSPMCFYRFSFNFVVSFFVFRIFRMRSKIAYFVLRLRLLLNCCCCCCCCSF